jgi:hypothetical protein
MKRIKDDQTRCADIQTGSKIDGLQKYFTTYERQIHPSRQPQEMVSTVVTIKNFETHW